MRNMILKKIQKNRKSLESSKKNTVLNTFVNPYSYLSLRKYARLYYFDNIYVDGFSAVIVFKLFGYNVKRVSFDMTSLAPKIFDYCILKKKNIAFIGSMPLDVSEAVKSISIEFPDLNISYYHHGYINNDLSLRRKVILEICRINPDVVVVGMGCVLQEDFLVDLLKSGWVGHGYTCGGFLHQTASGGLSYYPKIFDKLNLRWLYRIYDEPKLFKRYVYEYPKFIFYALFDFFF